MTVKPIGATSTPINQLAQEALKKPGFLRTAEDIVNIKKSAYNKPGFLRTAEDLIDLKATGETPITQNNVINSTAKVAKPKIVLTPTQESALAKSGVLRSAEDLIEIQRIKPDALAKPGVLRSAEDLIDINYANRTPIQNVAKQAVASAKTGTQTISNSAEIAKEIASRETLKNATTVPNINVVTKSAAESAKVFEESFAKQALKEATTINPNAPLQITAKVPQTTAQTTQIIEKYAEGYAKNHPAVNPNVATQRANTAKPSLWSRMKGKMPKAPGWVKSVGNWYNTPIGETGLYQRVTGSANNLLAKGAQKGSESFVGSSSRFLQKVAGKMGQAAQSGIGRNIAATKLLSRGNVALATVFEAPAIIEAYKEGLGRGVAQTVQSGTKVGLGVAGGAAAVGGLMALGILSGPIGWGALAVGIAGSMIGYKVGDMLTGWLGKNKKGLFEKEVIPPQQPPQQYPPQPFGSVTNTTTTSYPFDLRNPLAGLPPLI